MAVSIYKANQHRILAGKQIYQNNVWKTIPANAKMWLNGAWHKIGSGAAENAVSIPADPEQSVTHDNGSEPSTGTKWYITPEGAGNMDGSSWANAASGSMIHVILLSCSSGDSVYFAEGDYTTDRTIVLPAGVNLYGGFDADTPAWSTRNGFTKQTVFTGNNAFGWMDGYAATAGQVVDGFVVKNYNSTITGSNATLRNSIVNLGTASLTNAYNSVFISTAATASKATQCNFFYGTSCYVETSANHVNVYGTSEQKVQTRLVDAQYCTAVNCSAGRYLSNGHEFYLLFHGSMTNCTAVNCSGNSGYIFSGSTTNCTAVNCSSNRIFTGSGYATNCTAVNCSAGNNGYIFAHTYATNCSAVNCSAGNNGYIFAGESTNCTAVNCSAGSSGYLFYSSAAICTVVNCSVMNSPIFNSDATHCLAISCSAGSSGFLFNSDATYCSGVNCSGFLYIFQSNNNVNVKNCLSWNNSGTEFSNYSSLTTCAGSNHNENLALTLGTDNSIARFTNTGYAPSQGVQDVGDCPNPVSDPDGYAAYLTAFGDWHPLANSFLVGKGTRITSITTDFDGVRRPNLPTIGAYEPVPANA